MHKVLYDCCVVKCKEPWQRLVHQGMILGDNNEKMSKSRGNVVNPDDIVASHGADSLRLYEMFMGPLEASLPWSTNGLDGSRKWLDRVYRLMIETGKLSDENDHSLDRVYHQTVKKVTDDFEKLGFNTAISQMMIFINECYKAEHVYKEYAENFIKMLSCIAPHICEEMWQQLGHNDSIAYEPWPTYDEKMLVSDTVQMGIQVNGKLRAKIEVAKDADDESVMPVCGYVNHDEKKNGRTDIFLPSNEQEDLKKSIQIMPELYENRMLQIIWNKIFWLDVIKQNHIRFKEEMFIGEDFRFLLEYMKAAKISGFFFVNKALCHYMRDNENSLMSRLLETKIQDSLDNLKIMYELMGKSADEIQKLIATEKEKQIEYYAYTIMHDENMTTKEKKERIFQLPSDCAEQLYKQQKALQRKEGIYRLKSKLLKK